MAKIVIDGSRAQTARTVILAAFAAVALALAGTFGLHKLKTRGLTADLPARLGGDISQTANGFTYSQSERGHTVFTIHASRITQFKGDEVELHEVDVTLYGPQGSNRKDHIAGREFLYNKSTGEIAAQGPVLIDLSSPGADANTIHVETSGLRYSQKTGRAATEAPIAFAVPHGSGKAVGGSYDAQTGMLILEKAIELHATENGSPATTLATHAEISRDAHTAYLLNVHSGFSGAQTAADQAILHFRPDGTLLRVDAENQISVLTQEGSTLHATNASVDLDAHAQPVTAYAGGGVNYHSGTPDLEMHGNAVESILSFAPGSDGKQVLRHAEFRNAVSFVLQRNSLAGDPRGLATREITASKIDIDFVPGAGGREEASDATASGGAKVDLHDLPFGKPQRHTTIYAGLLAASLRNGQELRSLNGGGGTQVVDYAPDGATDTTTGDTLRVSFLPVSAAHESTAQSKGRAPGTESAVVDTAEESGRVTYTAQPARGAKTKSGAPQQPFYAEGASASYRASDAVIHLSGAPGQPARVHDSSFSLTAAGLDAHRLTGEASATGDVRAAYAQAPVKGVGGAGALHITAASASLSRVEGTAAFAGSPGAPARLWQGGNSVTAPMLELAKGGGVLRARDPAGSAGSVHSVFSGEGVIRITSSGLLYADSTRTATFDGPVLAQQPAGEFRADAAQLFLTEAEPGKASRLDHLVAVGHVSITEPNRRGSGNKLVYTAADNAYALTGGPPRASDAVHGSVTGAELLFKPNDESVEVLNGDAAGLGQRTVTDTRTPN